MKNIKKAICLMLAICLITLIPLYCFAVSGISPSTSLTSSSYYYIRNAKSNHYLDAENANNYNVIQYEQHGALNQTWKLIPVSTNVYRLENQSPYYQNQGRKCLSVSEYNDDVDLYYRDTSLETQKWTITRNSDGKTFTIKSNWDNKVLQVVNSSTSSATDVVKASANSSNDSQKWYFEKIPNPNTSRTTLEQSFPDAKYWNHNPSSSNSATSVRTVACTHHGNCANSSGVYDGACGCNSYTNSIQCNGFAKYMAKLVYDTNITNSSWNYSTNSSSLYFVKPGDYIRYDGHSVFVVNVKPDLSTIMVAECNYGGDCIIKWYREISIFTIMNNFEHIYKSPYVFIS